MFGHRKGSPLPAWSQSYTGGFPWSLRTSEPQPFPGTSPLLIGAGSHITVDGRGEASGPQEEGKWDAGSGRRWGGGDGRGGMRQSMGSDQEGDFLSRFKRSLQAG